MEVEGMKIAFITSHIVQSKQWIWFSEELLRLSVNHIHIVISELPTPLEEDLTRLGIRVYGIRYRSKVQLALAILKVAAILRREGVDIAHTELPYGNLVGQLAALFAGTRVRISTCENASWAFDFNSWQQKFIDRITYRLANKIITLTPLSSEFLQKHYGVRQSKLQVIFHSLKVSDYLAIDPMRVMNLRNQLGIADNIPVIGMVARMEYWKGHETAIEAMAIVHRDFPEAKLLIFGSQGSYADNVISMIRQKELDGVVSCKGFVRDNIALYRLFDVHLHIPINQSVETFGINIIEGMISGCAQVLTRSGISNYTAIHEENALVVPYQSPTATAEAILRLLRDHTYRQRLGAKAREFALHEFSYEKKVKEHLTIYKMMLDHR